MGIFSFFRKKEKKEIEKKIIISEEERLLGDLRKAIKLLKLVWNIYIRNAEGISLAFIDLASGICLNLDHSKGLLEKVMYRISLIEDIAKNMTKDSLKQEL